MRAVDIIRKKRDGGRLDAAEIAWMVHGIASGEVPDYQWSALLMAIVLNDMDASETAQLTDAMMRSGSILDLSNLEAPKVDKHSTGGVGDKTSLILAPIAAAAGLCVPMVSGRGLGHTGGTLDKLESIPGFRVDLDLSEARSVLERLGLVMIGQTAELAPADRFLYALRDATATVESIPLIAASILSKKLAEGIDALVLDVKTGDGAFLPQLEDSRQLARAMCNIGASLGKAVSALISSMEQPLGNAVGNSLEVAECLEVLRGRGPSDLIELSLELTAEMLVLGKQARSREEGLAISQRSIDDGCALERFRRLIEAQGGDPRVVDEPDRLPTAEHAVEIRARRSGIVSRVAARAIGHATMLIGAGRSRVDSRIDPAAGVVLLRKVGDEVEENEPLCRILYNRSTHLAEARELIANAFSIADQVPSPSPLIVERLGSNEERT
jgi:pyrimidine-nucleoside phosphorylase/thymidine phosphorylase